MCILIYNGIKVYSLYRLYRFFCIWVNASIWCVGCGRRCGQCGQYVVSSDTLMDACVLGWDGTKRDGTVYSFLNFTLFSVNASAVVRQPAYGTRDREGPYADDGAR